MMGIVGELLITFGAIVLLFLAWQLWINNAVVAGQQQSASQELVKESVSPAWEPIPLA